MKSIEQLRRAVEADPDDPEARYDLALAYESRGNHREMVRQYLQVRMLDAALDRAEGVGLPDDLDAVEAIVLATLARLPEPFKSKLAAVPIVLEPRPSLAMVREGFDPRALGVCEGPPCFDESTVVEAPSRIVIYSSNLLVACRDEAELAEQVEITVLHEVGHYFGLDEDDMERLGLH